MTLLPVVSGENADYYACLGLPFARRLLGQSHAARCLHFLATTLLGVAIWIARPARVAAGELSSNSRELAAISSRAFRRSRSLRACHRRTACSMSVRSGTSPSG